LSRRSPRSSSAAAKSCRSASRQHWRQPLFEALAKLDLAPAAATDSQTAFALATDAGPLRYVTVIADAAGTHSNDFQRPRGLSVSLEGTSYTVRDLVHQQTLQTTTVDGRTQISLDMLTEPSTVLALYKQSPAKIEIDCASAPKLGAELVFRAAVRAADGRSRPQAMVRVR
jgi:hypothetical protein